MTAFRVLLVALGLEVATATSGALVVLLGAAWPLLVVFWPCAVLGPLAAGLGLALTIRELRQAQRGLAR